MSTTIYDGSKNSRFNPLAGVFTFALGTGLLGWYLTGIGGAVAADIRNFPASFQSLPMLTVAFALLKLVAYLSFGTLFALMVYVPLRNLWFRRVVSGELESVPTRIAKKRSVVLSIKVGQRIIRVIDRADLSSNLNERAAVGDQLRFTIGAFNRVLKVEKLS